MKTVSSLAAEWRFPPKLLLAQLVRAGIKVRNVYDELEEYEVDKFKQWVNEQKKASQPQAAKEPKNEVIVQTSGDEKLNVPNRRSGTKALRKAIDALPLTQDERTLLESIYKKYRIELREQEAARIVKVRDESKKRRNLRNEVKASLRNRAAARETEIKRIHKITGYSDFLRRVHGSFGTGKK